MALLAFVQYNEIDYDISFKVFRLPVCPSVGAGRPSPVVGRRDTRAHSAVAIRRVGAELAASSVRAEVALLLLLLLVRYGGPSVTARSLALIDIWQRTSPCHDRNIASPTAVGRLLLVDLRLVLLQLWNPSDGDLLKFVAGVDVVTEFDSGVAHVTRLRVGVGEAAVVLLLRLYSVDGRDGARLPGVTLLDGLLD